MNDRSAIIQALTSCSRGACSSCLYRGQGTSCRKKLMADAAEALTADYTRRVGELESLQKKVDAEASAREGE